MNDDTPVRNETIAAVLADVDGTLVTSEKVLTPRAIRAVKQLHERGVLFAVTSGRPPRGMKMLVDPLELKGPIAAFNGGMVVMPDMSVVEERTIPDDVTPAVVDAMRAGGLYVWIYRGTEWYVTDPHAPHAEHEASTVLFSPTVIPTYDGLLDRVVKVVGASDDHDLVARCEASIGERFGSHVSAARSQPYYLDVTHPTANKGVVIDRLSTDFHIPLEQIAALGDQPSDVLMFQRSGLSIAMANASDDVQHQATYVTASNDDEGFAKAIERHVLPRAAPPTASA
jgi:Cof subfamily protein (haloacid dehalogenase superfamily)